MKPAKRVNIVSIKMVKESSLVYSKRIVHSPEDSYLLLKDYFLDKDREHFVVLCLDTKNQPTNINTAHIGSLNTSIVHPREVFKTAILSNAASVIVAHNHPSGICDPSPEDLAITKRLVEAGDILGIQVLDHLIIGDCTYLSFKERRYM